MKKKDSYYKSMEDLLREVNFMNLYDFNTVYKDELKELKSKLLQDETPEFRANLDIYITYLIAHITQIREEDAFDVFMAGFKNGIEFHNHARSKYCVDSIFQENKKTSD